MTASVDVRIIRLKDSDVRRQSDYLIDFERLILANEPSYPSIRKWLHSKVLDGVRTGQRVAFVGYNGDKPSITAVVKRGTHSKFCHLKIAEELQDKNLGEAFFAMMTAEVKRFATDIHFTLPESLWESERAFFSSFGFESIDLAANQYRSGEAELLCSAPFSDVWRATLSKLPKIARLFSTGGFQLDAPLLLSLQPRYADAIIRGKKRIEIRRRFSRRWIGSRAVLLATRPARALLGEATIAAVHEGTASSIWEQFGDDIGSDECDFREYCGGPDRVIFAVQLIDARPYLEPVPVQQLSYLIGQELLSPQSYADLTHDYSPWRSAIHVAALLHSGVTMRVNDRSARKVESANTITLPNETMSLF